MFLVFKNPAPRGARDPCRLIIGTVLSQSESSKQRKMILCFVTSGDFEQSPCNLRKYSEAKTRPRGKHFTVSQHYVN